MVNDIHNSFTGTAQKRLNANLTKLRLYIYVMFLLYINDLFQVPTKGKIVGFADDTAVFYERENWETT